MLPAYDVARLVEDNTQPGERIFSLISVPEAYTDREVLEFWHSAQADQLSDTLRVAAARNDVIFDIRAAVDSARDARGCASGAAGVAGGVDDSRDHAYSPARHPISGGPQWELHAWPNVWELPLAFDRKPGDALAHLGTGRARACTWRRISTARCTLSGAVMTVANRGIRCAVRILRARARRMAFADEPAVGDAKRRWET